MTAIKLSEPYAPRRIRFLHLWEPTAWRIKVYGIACADAGPSEALVSAGKRVALERLKQTAASHAHYGLGFLGVHEGRGANFVFIDWWADENELHHHVYVSYPDAPERLEYAMPTGSIACVWDLAILSFERQAWIETVLDNPDGPDPEAYLARRLDATV